MVYFGPEKLSILAALYHDSKTGTFEKKIEKLFVKDVRFRQALLVSF